MKLILYTILFLILNFGALYIGNILMADGPEKVWYASLNKAPWTPPGWVFGAAWFTIMVCFSIYMAYLYKYLPESKTIILYGIQFVLNVSWNYIFFNKHYISLGFLVIFCLTIIIGVFLFYYYNNLGKLSVLIAPYFLWLLIATSLNGFILFNN